MGGWPRLHFKVRQKLTKNWMPTVLLKWVVLNFWNEQSLTDFSPEVLSLGMVLFLRLFLCKGCMSKYHHVAFQIDNGIHPLSALVCCHLVVMKYGLTADVNTAWLHDHLPSSAAQADELTGSYTFTTFFFRFLAFVIAFYACDPFWRTNNASIRAKNMQAALMHACHGGTLVLVTRHSAFAVSLSVRRSPNLKFANDDKLVDSTSTYVRGKQWVRGRPKQAQIVILQMSWT